MPSSGLLIASVWCSGHCCTVLFCACSAEIEEGSVVLHSHISNALQSLLTQPNTFLLLLNSVGSAMSSTFILVFFMNTGKMPSCLLAFNGLDLILYFWLYIPHRAVPYVLKIKMALIRLKMQHNFQIRYHILEPIGKGGEIHLRRLTSTLMSVK